MANELHLYHYYTSRYITAYRDLDDNEYVCTARATAPRIEWQTEDSVTKACQVTLAPKELERARRLFRKARRRASYNITFTRFLERLIGSHFAHGCGCEHDCCGHYNGYGVATRHGRRQFTVLIHSSRNI